MSFVARKFGTLFVLVLVAGLVAGVLMARRGVQVDLGTIGGVKLALLQPVGKTGAATATSQAATTPQARTSQPGGAATSTGATGGQPFARPLSGTVTKIDGSTLSVTAQDGSLITATLGSGTTVVKSSAIAIADVKAGDSVTVIGQAASDGSIAAQQVTVGAGGQSPALARVGGGAGRTGGGTAAGGFSAVTGTVQQVDGNTLTISVANGSVEKATLGASTRLQKTSEASSKDITAGDQVIITGQAGADGAIAATAIQIGEPR